MVSDEAGLYWVTIQETSVSGWEWLYTPQRLVPLTHVHAEAVIVETTAEVKLTQKYHNPLSHPIEAIYVFPLDEHAAVCEFEAEIQGKKVVGVVKEKEQANAEYNQAVARGDGAYLLEQAKADIFRARVGNIPPGVEVSISIKYVAEMKNELEKVRFLLPTYIAPRYTPADTPADQVAPEGPTASYVPYKLSVGVTAVSIGGFVSIESPSHAINTEMNGNNAKITLDSGVTELTKDFLLQISYASPHEPKVIVEDNEKGSLAAMITLFPKFQFVDSKTELIFIVDRSGSMESKVNDLREAMQLFMRSLPEDCYFNIVGFGDSFTKLFPESRIYNDQTLEAALNHVSTIQADLGGTELLEPLKQVLGLKVIPDYARQVFVLTDGQVSNTEQVISLVQKNKNSRVFSLGIGDSVSHHLVDGLARAGRGTAFYVMENERMERKVLKQLKDATQPALNDVKVNWGMSAKKPSGSIGAAFGAKVLSFLGSSSSASPPEKTSLHQAPFRVPAVFSDNHFRIYAIFPATTKLPPKVTVDAVSPDGILRVDLPLDKDKIIKRNLIHTLAARSLIRDLEEESSHLHSTGNASASDIKAEITRLGLTYSLTSKHTSFLAIEERSEGEKREYDCFVPPPQEIAEQDEQVSYLQSAGLLSGRGGGLSSQMSAPPQKAMKNKSGGLGLSLSMKLKKKSRVSAPAMAAPPRMMMADEYDSSMAPMAPPPAPMPSSAYAPPPPPAVLSEAGLIANDADEDAFAEQKQKPARLKRDESESEEDFKEMAVSSGKQKEREVVAADKKAVPVTPRAKLTALLALQSTKGDFAYSEKLAVAVGLTLGDIEPALAEVSQLSQITDEAIRKRVWATVLALTFFKRKLPQLAAEWELVDKKARKWVAAQNVQQLDAIFAVAEGKI